jgi:hypothetical protein
LESWHPRWPVARRLQSTETSEHAWSPKQEDLTFVCMDAKDPAYMRAAVERDPPVIAQQ